MESFRVRLEACDPAQHRFRVYRIDAGTDLFGHWLVDVTYGRIGSRGRTVRHVAANEAEARKIVRHCLQRRGTAERRIGVGYRIRELTDPAQWMTAFQADSGTAGIYPQIASHEPTKTTKLYDRAGDQITLDAADRTI